MQHWASSNLRVTPSHTLATTIQQNISKMNTQSSPVFDPVSASFIKHAEKMVQDRFKMSVAKAILKTFAPTPYWLVPFVSDRRCYPTTLEQSQDYASTQIGSITALQNYRLLATNGCIYRLFVNVVKDLLTDWALAEHQIPDSQFGLCPTGNTIQPLFVLRHILATAKKEKRRCTLLFWISLLPTIVFQENDCGSTYKESGLHSTWEILFNPCTEDASTFS